MGERGVKAGRLDTRGRVVAGALGGLTPVILNMLVVDLSVALQGATALVAASYALRAVALTVVGGVAGWLHDDETRAARVFQLGMVAPALLTGMINGAAVRADAGLSAPSPTALGVAVLHAAEAPAQASWLGGESGQVVEPSAVVVPTESLGQQVLRGLLGVQPDRREWLVQLGQYATQEQAVAAFGRHVRQSPLGLTVYAPSPAAGLDVWVLAVGGQHTRAEAEALLERALSAGLPATLRTLQFSRK